jgi:hypothetical protein
MEMNPEKNKKRRLGAADESENMHPMNEGVQLYIEPCLSTRAQINDYLLKTTKDMAINHHFFKRHVLLEALSHVSMQGHVSMNMG